MQENIQLRAADNIRILSAAMVEAANSGHPGGPMGGADFIQILYTEFMNFDPNDPRWPFRDRFFLDPGHMSAMLYSALAFQGKYSIDDLKNFRQWGSPTPGHPEVDIDRGIENTSGPLGQGHVMGIGAAIAERFLTARFGDWMEHKTYAYISDGGIQEEISQGAGRIAGYLGLSNFIMFFDSNDLQLSSPTEDVTHEDTAAKYESWGWRVMTIDGHDHEQIRAALKAANEETEKPFLIIGKTIMGKGAVDAEGGSMEANYHTHGQPLSNAGASFERTVSNLGGDPENPFKIFDDVKKFYSKVLDEKRDYVKRKKKEQKAWASANPDLAKKLELYLSGKAPEVNFGAIEQKNNIATRNASSAVLSVFAEQVGNMIVSSADLSNSDKTDGFLKKTTAFTKGNFHGAFLQAGVAELTMAAIANGLALHGGVIPAVATFFVFSDFMKPAIRLAALMKLPVKYVWTHDAFRVGEDGPTHQPVEQEAQIRLLEKLKNHSGNMSLLALRPADAAETTVAWEMAMENTDCPTALILSRQNIKDLPAPDGKSRYEAALEAKKGAYIVREAENPDVVLVANGSEVSTLVDAADILEESDGLQIQIVSAISEGLFRTQTDAYQKKVIPENVPVFGLTAGLPDNLLTLVGPKGKSIGLDHFGYSAPAAVLDEKFGFTGEQVSEKIKDYLKNYN
ncbi:MAG: transketolase [Cyclobacteriaceae bacterium]